MQSETDVVPFGERIEGLEGRYVEIENGSTQIGFEAAIRLLQESGPNGVTYCLGVASAGVAPEHALAPFRAVRLSAHRLLIQVDVADRSCQGAVESEVERKPEPGMARYLPGLVERSGDGSLTFFTLDGVNRDADVKRHAAAEIKRLAAARRVEVAAAEPERGASNALALRGGAQSIRMLIVDMASVGLLVASEKKLIRVGEFGQTSP